MKYPKQMYITHTQYFKTKITKNKTYTIIGPESCTVLCYIEGLVIVAQCTATFSRSIVLPQI